MKRFFPLMNDDTEKGMHFALFAYWIFAFEVIPTWLPLLFDGFWGDLQIMSWMEIAYHVFNSVVIVAMLNTYLKDSFFNVQMDPKGFLKIVGFSALVMLVLSLVMRSFLGDAIIDIFPITEKVAAITSGYMVTQQPVFGTICFTIFVPFAVVGLFYASCFAPVCRRSHWLGYVVVTVLLAIPYVLDILWRHQEYLDIPTYLLHLPMHWIACWTYQKADTVWAPIATLAIFNFGTSLIALI